MQHEAHKKKKKKKKKKAWPVIWKRPGLWPYCFNLDLYVYTNVGDRFKICKMKFKLCSKLVKAL